MKTKKTQRRILIAKLDVLFSLAIRLRDKKIYGGICPLCGKRPIDQCFHFITRSKYSIRWDLRNAIASCGGCNILYEHDQDFIDYVFGWYKTKYTPEAWEQLKSDGRQLSHFSIDDLEKKYYELKNYVESNQ